MPGKRPFGVTLLLWLVLSLSAWGAVRLIAALRWWDVLNEFEARLSPVYLSFTGLGWLVAGVVLLWAMFSGKVWTRLAITVAISLWLMGYWIEQFFFESQRANLPFALIISILLFMVTLISAFNRTSLRDIGVRPPEMLSQPDALKMAVNQGLRVVLGGTIQTRRSGYLISVTATQAVSGEVITRSEEAARARHRGVVEERVRDRALGRRDQAGVLHRREPNADGHDEHVERSGLLDELLRRRALAGDDVRMVERRHGHHAALWRCKHGTIRHAGRQPALAQRASVGR